MAIILPKVVKIWLNVQLWWRIISCSLIEIKTCTKQTINAKVSTAGSRDDVYVSHLLINENNSADCRLTKITADCWKLKMCGNEKVVKSSGQTKKAAGGWSFQDWLKTTNWPMNLFLTSKLSLTSWLKKWLYLVTNLMGFLRMKLNVKLNVTYAYVCTCTSLRAL